VWQLLAIGFFTLGLPWALLFWGEQFVSPALCSILNSTTPIFTVIVVAVLVKSEHAPWNKWLGVAIGFLGVLIIFWPEVADGETSSLHGMIAVTGMAMCYSIGIVWLKSIAHKVSASVALAIEGVGGLLFLVPFSLLFEWNAIVKASWLETNGWVAILYLGIFSTAVAQLIFFALLRAWGPVRTSAVTYLIPIVAVILDWIAFGTFLSVNAIIGATIILGGVRLIHAPPTLPCSTQRSFQNHPVES
jgi:drug/metabolite transporter (DMT)-like permease